MFSLYNALVVSALVKHLIVCSDQLDQRCLLCVGEGRGLFPWRGHCTLQYSTAAGLRGTGHRAVWPSTTGLGVLDIVYRDRVHARRPPLPVLCHPAAAAGRQAYQRQVRERANQSLFDCGAAASLLFDRQSPWQGNLCVCLQVEGVGQARRGEKGVKHT